VPSIHRRFESYFNVLAAVFRRFAELALALLNDDRGLLVQALVNLIVNAKEAMPNGGRVCLKARLSPFSTLNGQIHKAVEIKVRDHGVGIAASASRRKIASIFSIRFSAPRAREPVWDWHLPIRLSARTAAPTKLPRRRRRAVNLSLVWQPPRRLPPHVEAYCHRR
jgi:hypothetical protein